jgi:hypothetical protein
MVQMEAFKAAADNADGGVPYAGPSAGQNVISKVPRQNPSQGKVIGTFAAAIAKQTRTPRMDQWEYIYSRRRIPSHTDNCILLYLTRAAT